MSELKGQARDLRLHYVQESIRRCAAVADESARGSAEGLTALALAAEAVLAADDGDDAPFRGLSGAYVSRTDDAGNDMALKIEEFDSGAFISIAGGCPRLPLGDAARKRLCAYEALEPGISDAYARSQNVDGVFLFDLEHNIFTFHTAWDFAGDFAKMQSADLRAMSGAGLTFYDWFDACDLPANPDRRAVWSDIAFIAIENDWIMHIKVPFFRDRYGPSEEMVGIVSAHYNLEWLMANTVEMSAIPMLAVKDDATLIGMNDAARALLPLRTFRKSDFAEYDPFDPNTTQAIKKPFVFETLNLDHGKGDEVVRLSTRLKSEFVFRTSISGRDLLVMRARSPELGINFVALLEDV